MEKKKKSNDGHGMDQEQNQSLVQKGQTEQKNHHLQQEVESTESEKVELDSTYQEDISMSSKRKIAIRQILTLSKQQKILIEEIDKAQKQLVVDDTLWITVNEVSVTVFIGMAGWMSAMISDDASVAAMSKFNTHSQATYAEILGAEPYMDEAKALLIQLHKEINEINADNGRDGSGLQDISGNDEGEW